MHPFTKFSQVQQAMIEEEKWAAPSMTYFRPHFMVPALGDGNARAHDPPAMTNGFFNGYPDQALDLGQNPAVRSNQGVDRGVHEGPQGARHHGLRHTEPRSAGHRAVQPRQEVPQLSAGRDGKTLATGTPH